MGLGEGVLVEAGSSFGVAAGGGPLALKSVDTTVL